MKAHTGEKPSDSDISELVTEARSSNGIQLLYEKTLKCSECKFVCVSNKELSNHLTTHNIYSCNQCEYRNSTIKRLRGHIKKHNDKRFKCNKCAFKGTSNTTLMNHMKSHFDDILCSTPPKSDNDLHSMKNSKRELSISPDKIDLNKNDKRTKN